MKFVVKLGGVALENPAVLHGCAQAVRDLVEDGNQVTLVHGGGVALTRTLKQLGKQSQFVAGLRVTDAETVAVAEMVLVGKINTEIVGLINRCGAKAVYWEQENGHWRLFQEGTGAPHLCPTTADGFDEVPDA